MMSGKNIERIQRGGGGAEHVREEIEEVSEKRREKRKRERECYTESKILLTNLSKKIKNFKVRFSILVTFFNSFSHKTH